MGDLLLLLLLLLLFLPFNKLRLLRDTPILGVELRGEGLSGSIPDRDNKSSSSSVLLRRRKESLLRIVDSFLEEDVFTFIILAYATIAKLQ